MHKEIKKIGSNIDLKGMVIHQVTKVAGVRVAVINPAKKLLNIDEKERIFIGKIYKSYFDNSKPVYGIFAEEDIRFKTSLSDFKIGNDFYNFSNKATELYKQILASSTPATGGFLIFAHFDHLDKKYEYMLVMTITNKDGFVVSEDDLSIKDIKNLDLSKIDVACMINLTKWSQFESDQNSDINTYLSFSKGNKDISYYFMSFIDCNNKTTKTESTNRLVKAIDQYCLDRGIERSERIRKRNEVFGYCMDCINSKKEILLSAISALINVDEVTDFEKYAADEDFSVSSIINGDKTKLKPMKYVTYKDNDMTIEFDASLITKGDVYFDRANRQLTFKNVSDKLADLIP